MAIRLLINAMSGIMAESWEGVSQTLGKRPNCVDTGLYSGLYVARKASLEKRESVLVFHNDTMCQEILNYGSVTA